MNRKIFGILVCTLLILSLLGSINVGCTPTQGGGEDLDQEQTEQDGGFACLYDDQFAQGFIPKKEMLTKIELLIKRNQCVISDLKIIIRESSYDGKDLVTSDLFLYEDLPVDTYTWVEFNFDDIHVTPGETYYIIWDGWNGANPNQTYYWGFGSGDPYENGESYYYNDDYEYWRILDDPEGDFCFKTYGRKNKPPREPNMPEGEIHLEPGVTYSFSTKARDPDKDRIKYGFDWSDGTSIEWTPFKESGEDVELSHRYYESKNYNLKVKAADEYGGESDWSEPLIVSVEDQPPNPPTIVGPNAGKPGASYTYEFTAVDPNRDQVKYHIIWSDGGEEDTDYYESGETVSISHSWDETGKFAIFALAENKYRSDYTMFEVVISKNRQMNKPFMQLLQKFFESWDFPLLTRLLNL
jgi:hypothetical protein